jgi:NhaP-type Na+/H+ or K+/H+ antiporter
MISAFNIKKKEFYKNLGTILIYAVLGTIISILFIGFFMWYLGINGYYEVNKNIYKFNLKKTFTFQQSMAYGALISATDPVCIIAAFKQYTTDQNFYLLVFGESILNDAVSMVFYNTIVDFKETGSLLLNITKPLTSFLIILIGSTMVGMIAGFILSILFKKIDENFKNIEKIEKNLFIVAPYFIYLLTDLIGLSSIVAIFFTGISLAIYSKPYISDEAKNFIHDFYEEIASMSETIVFIFIGIAFFANHPYE